MLAMLPMFEGDKLKEQHSEIEKRLKLLRELQGAEIDKIKGTTPPQFPKEWRHWIAIDKNDTEEEKKYKYKYNSMVVKKKPYFFIYLYKTLMQSYNEYEKNFDSLSWKSFGISLKELLRKESKNNEEINFLRRYRKYSPVLETECVMNMLCKEIEDIEFDIKFKNENKSLLENFQSATFKCNNFTLETLYKIYKEYKALKKYKGIVKSIENDGIQDDDLGEILKDIMYSTRDEYKYKMYNIVSSSRELFNYLIEMCKRYGIKNNDFIWDILGDDIIDIIPYGDSKIILDSESGFEYLGHRYKSERIYREVQNVDI